MYMPCVKCACVKMTKHLHTFFVFGLKLKKSRSVFDLVTVLISKRSFFQHRVWPVYQGKSYLHGIALPDFYIVSPLFYKKLKQARVPTFVWLFRDVATSAKDPRCDEGTYLRLRDFAVVPLMPTREKEYFNILRHFQCIFG